MVMATVTIDDDDDGYDDSDDEVKINMMTCFVMSVLWMKRERHRKPLRHVPAMLWLQNRKMLVTTTILMLMTMTQ